MFVFFVAAYVLLHILVGAFFQAFILYEHSTLLFSIFFLEHVMYIILILENE